MFIYFLKGKQSATKKELVDVGLSVYSEAGEAGCAFGIKSVRTTKGPDGNSGVMCAFPPNGRDNAKIDITFNENQIWRDAGKYMVGYDKNHKPKPKDLERGEVFGGYGLTLGDGNQWVIPVVRRINGDSALPSRLKFDATTGGWIKGDVMPVYKKLFNLTCELFDRIKGVAEQSDDDSEEVYLSKGGELACGALSVNYFVGPQEIDLLGLLTTNNISDILRAAMDWQAVIEYLKKNTSLEAATTSVMDGGEA